MSISENLRKKLMEKISPDPTEAGKTLYASLVSMQILLDLGGPKMSDERMAEILTQCVCDYLGYFKTKVLDEMLESQKATNDALAAALRGGRG